MQGCQLLIRQFSGLKPVVHHSVLVGPVDGTIVAQQEAIAPGVERRHSLVQGLGLGSTGSEAARQGPTARNRWLWARRGLGAGRPVLRVWGVGGPRRAVSPEFERRAKLGIQGGGRQPGVPPPGLLAHVHCPRAGPRVSPCGRGKRKRDNRGAIFLSGWGRRLAAAKWFLSPLVGWARYNAA